MSRRAFYMYGNLLPKSETGSLGLRFGNNNCQREYRYFRTQRYYFQTRGQSRIIDGVRVDFIYTPESEAPAEMMFYFPDLKAFCQAENISHTLHNLYTLRGAQVRNGQKWSMYIDRCLQKFGNDVGGLIRIFIIANLG